MNSFAEGYAFFSESMSGQAGALLGDSYVEEVETAVEKFAGLLNNGLGNNNKGIEQLKGDVAEFWHAGTFNVNSVVKHGGKYRERATVPRSREFASPDGIVGSRTFGIKYYKTPKDTLKQQAKNAWESYNKYKGESTIDEYLKERNIVDPNASVYEGQVRIVPKEQLKEIEALLKLKIAGEKSTRPEQGKRYEETLKMLDDRMRDGRGTESIPLDTDTAKFIAQALKEGGITEEKLRNLGLCTEDLIQFSHVMSESFRAGLTAATISVVLKIAPEIYKALSIVMQCGEIDRQQFKRVGFAALNGASEGYLRGTISAALTSSCSAGLLGASLKSIDPSVIGAVTVLAMNTMKNSFHVANGTMSRNALANELVQEMFVTTYSLVVGGVTQAFIHIPVLGFMIGSFVGSVVGAFSYNTGYNALLSFCVDTGFTMFGLVEQDYELPDDVLKSIGAEVFEYEQFAFEEFKNDEFKFEEFSFKEFQQEGLSIQPLRRGVIGVSRIGYVN